MVVQKCANEEAESVSGKPVTMYFARFLSIGLDRRRPLPV